MLPKILSRAVLSMASLCFVGWSVAPMWGASVSGASIHTLRDGGAYRIYVNGVERASVPVNEMSNTVVTAVTRDGSKAAIIPEHDTNKGESLLILDVASGKLSTLFEGPVTSAAFSPSGDRLAFTVKTDHGAALRLGTADSDGSTIGELQGREVDLLGFSADGLSVLAVVYPDRQDEGTHAPSVVRMSTTDGQAEVVLEGNPIETEHRFSDVRLVRINGRDRLSFIRSGHQMCVGSSVLQLATLDGRVVSSFRPTTHDVYRGAVWSSDGRQVAYAVQVCPDKALIVADRDAAVARQARGTGVFVADVTAGRATRVVEGMPTASLLAVDDGVVRLGTDRDGALSLDSKAIAAGTRPAAKVQELFVSTDRARGAQAVTARTNMAKHVHQVYDTRDAFDGRGSCGPTSAVMTMAGYQLAEWGMYVNYGGYHYTGWGRYVTDAYSYNGTTFNRTQPDYSGRGAWAGAHGWVYLPCCGAGWANMLDYMNRHTGWAIQHGWDPTWIRNEINRGQLVAVSGTMNGLAHIAMIKGWRDDGTWVVNDPFGPNTSGAQGGADQIYSTTYLHPSQVWSN